MTGRPCCAVLIGLLAIALATPVCPVDGKYEARDIDFDEWEIWPLSGGLASGVEATLTATKIEDVATIHFVTAQYEVLASYTLDRANKKVWRTTCRDADASSYGGWPFDDGTALHLTFHNSRPVLGVASKDVWAFSSDKQRMPWFDSEAATDELAVYAMVSKGFVDGEIVDRRKECSTTCHPQECTDSSNKIVTCVGGCKSRTPSSVDGMIVSTCSADTPSGNGVFCCEGRQLRHIAIDAAKNGDYDGKYLRVHDDPAAVRAACKSFGVGAELDECLNTASHKVKVDSYSQSDAMLSVLLPQLFAKGASYRVNIPVEILDLSPVQWRTIKRKRTINEAWGIKVEEGAEFAGLISEVIDANDVDFAGFQWWYVNMVNIGCTNDRHDKLQHCKADETADWWVSYNHFVEENVGKKIEYHGYDYFVTDEPVSHTDCIDVPDWRDIGDDNDLKATCQNYEEYEFCDDYGVAKANFTSRAYKDASDWTFENLESARPTGGWSAAFMCCTCGGGIHAAPPADGGADSASLQSIMFA